MGALTTRARHLRKHQTDAERRFWFAVRDRRLGGYKFRRQVWMGSFIADFVCIERRLVVEIDGGQHAEQRGYDAERTEELQRRGYRVVRYWNSDVLKNIDGVLTRLLEELAR